MKVPCSPVYTQQTKRLAVEIFETPKPKAHQNKSSGCRFVIVSSRMRKLQKHTEKVRKLFDHKNLKYIQQCEC